MVCKMIRNITMLKIQGSSKVIKTVLQRGIKPEETLNLLAAL